MTEQQRKKIEQHGRRIQLIFPAVKDLDPVGLCKRLRRIETGAHRDALDLCNGLIDENQFDARKEKTASRLEKLLDWRAAGVPVHLNSDPRGYALKIDSDWMRESPFALHRDMGGYGIIAPEIDG